MTRLKYILRSINLINTILFVLLVIAIKYMAFPSSPTAPYEIPLPEKKEKPSLAAIETAPEKKNLFPSDFMIISEQTLFHPERKIPSAKKEAQTAALPKPDFFLYGTLITDDIVVAYMEDKKSPYSTPGREKRQTPLKPGESLSGFTLKEVSSDRVTMIRGEEQVVVLLNDPQKPKTRDLAITTSSTASHQPPQGKPTPQPTQAQGSQPPAIQPQTSPPPAGTLPSEQKQPIRTPDKEKAVNTFLDFFKKRNQ